MDKATLQALIADDDQGLLDIDTKGIWRIYGRINGKRGGCFMGFDENDAPIFGGSNLIYAPVWWDHSFREVDEVCDKIKAKCAECEAYPSKCE